MRALIFLVSLLAVTLVAAPAVAQKQPLGIFFSWGAFAQMSPRKCYAIAQAHNLPDRLKGQAYASVGTWPGRRVRSQLHFRLSRAKRAGSAVILRIDGRAFQLVGGGTNAWAPNARADAALVAAMRTGLEMSVETRSETGGRFRDRYHLRGAASAIDAAAIACVR